MENENTTTIVEKNMVENEANTENKDIKENEAVKDDVMPESEIVKNEVVENSETVTETENLEKDVVPGDESKENTVVKNEEPEKNEVPRVLIVEDDETARISLKIALEAENIFVEAVENGANAENMVRYSSFDVVIVDYRLPDIDGLNLIKKMKIIVPDLMTVIVTAHISVEIAIESMKMGAYDYMAKPLDIPNLVNTIYKILKDKKDLYDSRQKVSELVSKRSIDYMFNDEKVSIITASDPNILVDGKSKGGLFKSIKKFFVGIKNYYWGA